MFKIIIQKDRMFAPSMIVDASNEEDAEKKARQLSGLGRFESWCFSPVKIKSIKYV